MDLLGTNQRVIEQFRAGGEIEGMHRDRLLLLTTTGRRSGAERVSPMMFHPDGDRLLVIASNMGAARHPAWYLNLVDHPKVEVQVKGDRFHAVARTAEGAERGRLWRLMTGIWPDYDVYQQRTARQIPVVVLERT